MTLHPLTSKGGAFVSKLGFSFWYGILTTANRTIHATRSSVTRDGLTERSNYLRHRRKCKRFPSAPPDKVDGFDTTSIETINLFYRCISFRAVLQSIKQTLVCAVKFFVDGDRLGTVCMGEGEK